MGFGISTAGYAGIVVVLVIAVLALTGHCSSGLEVGLR